MAQKKLFALLVSGGEDCFEDLRALLKNQGIEVWRARTCDEVTRLLDQTHPELIFTTDNLADGMLSDIVGLTEKASVPTNLIVVGKSKDTQLHLSTMGYQAFDLILPPFETDALTQVVQVAAEDARHRRAAQSIQAVC